MFYKEDGSEPATSPCEPADLASSELTSSRKKRRERGRAGSPNYLTEDVELLLVCVEQHEPLQANDLALVQESFTEQHE